MEGSGGRRFSKESSTSRGDVTGVIKERYRLFQPIEGEMLVCNIGHCPVQLFESTPDLCGNLMSGQSRVSTNVELLDSWIVVLW